MSKKPSTSGQTKSNKPIEVDYEKVDAIFFEIKKNRNKD